MTDRARGHGEAPADLLESPQDGLLHPAHQVFFRAGLIACREYMARFVEAQDPAIAMSIRANWWPSLGQDFGPPRKLDVAELTSGEFGTPAFKCKTAEEVSPTQEALPIALHFLESRGEAAAPLPSAAGALGDDEGLSFREATCLARFEHVTAAPKNGHPDCVLVRGGFAPAPATPVRQGWFLRKWEADHAQAQASKEAGNLGSVAGQHAGVQPSNEAHGAGSAQQGGERSASRVADGSAEGPVVTPEAAPAGPPQALIEARQVLKLLAVVRKPKNPVLGRLAQAVVDAEAQRSALFVQLRALPRRTIVILDEVGHAQETTIVYATELDALLPGSTEKGEKV